MVRLIDRPRPSPPLLVLWKGAKTSSACQQDLRDPLRREHEPELGRAPVEVVENREGEGDRGEAAPQQRGGAGEA